MTMAEQFNLLLAKFEKKIENDNASFQEIECYLATREKNDIKARKEFYERMQAIEEKVDAMSRNLTNNNYAIMAMLEKILERSQNQDLEAWVCFC